MILSDRSEKNLAGVHPDLVRVMRETAARTPFPFVVVEGLRSVEREIELISRGASALKDPTKSKHCQGLAVDVVVFDENGQPVWRHASYRDLAAVVLQVADELGVDIVWGGSWHTFIDDDHFELATPLMEVTQT